MAQFLYAFLFSAIMSGNAVTTNNVILSVVDWLACVWLFISGVILTLQHYKSDKLEINVED